MKEFNNFIENNTKEYLILDGNIPTISLGYVEEELILYNVNIDKYKVIFDTFSKITNQTIASDSLISELSHGQKLILSVIISINSLGNKILFRNFFTSISDEKKIKLMREIQKKIDDGKIIKILDDNL